MATTSLRTSTGYRSGLYDWLTTTDHKKIGILYLGNSILMFLVGGVFALVVRLELAQPGLQFLTDAQYNQVFTIHASLMLFLFVIPVLAGFGNYIVPLMIGAPDMPFPRINAFSFWMLPLAAIVTLSRFATRGGSRGAGWTHDSALAPAKYEAIGTDLCMVSRLLIGTSLILGAINFIVTIFKMRAPGMTLLRMPVFVWTIQIGRASCRERV